MESTLRAHIPTVFGTMLPLFEGTRKVLELKKKVELAGKTKS